MDYKWNWCLMASRVYNILVEMLWEQSEMTKKFDKSISSNFSLKWYKYQPMTLATCLLTWSKSSGTFVLTIALKLTPQKIMKYLLTHSKTKCAARADNVKQMWLIHNCRCSWHSSSSYYIFTHRTIFPLPILKTFNEK